MVAVQLQLAEPKVKAMSPQCQQVLDVLLDGKTHTHLEMWLALDGKVLDIRARISELRRLHGYQIHTPAEGLRVTRGDQQRPAYQLEVGR